MKASVLVPAIEKALRVEDVLTIVIADARLRSFQVVEA